jgi:hypothetical protein
MAADQHLPAPPQNTCHAQPLRARWPYEQGGVVAAELEPDRLPAQTDLSWLVLGPRGDGAFEEPDLLKGLDAAADALLSLI